jgi:glycosyltransferase involved in cell wall biosynthesis
MKTVEREQAVGVRAKALPAPLQPRERVVVDGLGFGRASEKFPIRGVTYGPFVPDEQGQPFPSRDRLRDDFGRMRDIGINTIRTYHVPPRRLIEEAETACLAVLIDIPWPKHLCFLDDRRAQAEAHRLVRQAAKLGQAHHCVMGYSIGNEIRPDIVRWYGAPRVERFLGELADVARQTDPQGLVTYANYPPTEYLAPHGLDFATFNVYLHDRDAFRRYLFRLQNLVGEKPLVLGEIGMDTQRHGELEQAEFLAGHLAEVTSMGLAGALVFAWTDEWHTGGYPIEDWAFGITRADRSPKASYHALREVFQASPAQLLSRTPRVSVVVCSYNGGRTLEQCLRSLQSLDYPNYEVILVDDGSTDHTREIAARFPEVITIHQPNQGLSVARNVGLRAATGSVIAYTDSDCFADPNWLSHLVYQLECSGAAAVGGPNLTPDDGRLAACVAASPGQPTHVLVSDQEAEHIPGCNMAFRREALERIGGFDPRYRTAGDDVDVCWRLQHEGEWISFAPGAFVWHHRRQGLRTYLKQQQGYGEAEALLRFKHPERFTSRGDGKWRGMLYGNSLRGLRLSEPVIYRGTFGTGFFQTLYRPGPAHWAMLPASLEWHAVALSLGLLGFVWQPAWILTVIMLVLAWLVAGSQAFQAELLPKYDGLLSRAQIAVLCYLQPLLRSWTRYHTRLLRAHRPHVDPLPRNRPPGLPLHGRKSLAYWDDSWHDRTELLDRLVASLDQNGWGKRLDSGWTDWDLEIANARCTAIQVATCQEDHGGGRRLIRVRLRQRPCLFLREIGILAGVGAIGAGLQRHWPLCGVGIAALLGCIAVWVWGTTQAVRIVALIDQVAHRLGMVRCEPSSANVTREPLSAEAGNHAD